MASSTQQSSILLSAANVFWGTRECVEVTVNEIADNLDGVYFNVDAPESAGGTSQPFYVWFNLDGGSTDPAVAGRVGIEVATVTGDSAIVVAGKLMAAVEAHPMFFSSVEGDKVVVEAKYEGKVDSPASVETSGFVIDRNRVGIGGDLGRTQGGVEVSMETQSVQITADQTASLVIDEVFTGSTVDVTVTLLEMTPERWETIVGSVTGDTFTPAGGTQLVGYGDSRLYQSFFDLGGKLVLHPTRKAATDRSFDITLFRSVPKPSSINFSGEEPQVMEVTFSALLDNDTNSAIRLMAFGDSDQDVRA